MAGSIVRRVASAAALAASSSSLLTALATVAFASYLVGLAEDRRLSEAAVTFAAELEHGTTELARLRDVHHDETEEMEHTGMLFAVYDAQGALLVGDGRLGLPDRVGCATGRAARLRACRAQASNGLAAVVGSARPTLLPLLAAAAVLAALLAATLAWLASRRVSRLVVAPLTRLRERIARLDVAARPAGSASPDLGPPEDVAEVDALRAALLELFVRLEQALAQAHRFAGNAAHELRTPLTAVRAELELLAEELTAVDARESAQRAAAKVAELSVLVERLLVLSVPARSSEDVHEVVSLRDLLEDAVAALPAADQARVQLSDEEALVRGDAALLGTMVANAVANGLKFGERVTTGLALAAGQVVLRVDDDGPGIDAAERERVFEPFFRAADARRRRIPGHGLGLALIRHVARTHGGDASFVDKPDRGARLEIRLPAGRPELRAKPG